jgi:hypothetical protein
MCGRHVRPRCAAGQAVNKENAATDPVRGRVAACGGERRERHRPPRNLLRTRGKPEQTAISVGTRPSTRRHGLVRLTAPDLSASDEPAPARCPRPTEGVNGTRASTGDRMSDVLRTVGP